MICDMAQVCTINHTAHNNVNSSQANPSDGHSTPSFCLYEVFIRWCSLKAGIFLSCVKQHLGGVSEQDAPIQKGKMRGFL